MAAQTPDATHCSGSQAPRLRPALSRCLTIDPQLFDIDHWGSTPLLSHTAGFDDLFSPAAADELVTVRGLRSPFLRMAHNGTVLPSGSYTAGGGVGAQIDDQADATAIFGQMTAGATLVLQGLHRMWPPLRIFSDQLICDLGHPVQVNAYVTPASSQGFEPHYDTHDVFVLQIAGRKTWQLHRPVIDHPLPDQPWQSHRRAVARRAAEAPFLTTTLVPGDSLYVPRGWLHSAVAGQDTTSIHLTVGIHTLTGQDVLAALVDQVLSDDADGQFRRNLPIDATRRGSSLADLAAQLRKQILDAMADADPQQLAARVIDRFESQVPPEPVEPLAQLDAVDNIGADTIVRLRSGIRPHLSWRGDRVRLSAGGRYVEAPAACEEALRTLGAGGRVTPAALPGIPESTGVALVRRALRESIVVCLEH